MVKDGILSTHPLTQRILPGITRQVVLELAESAGLTVDKRYDDQAFLMAADEVFMTGTITEVLPITRIDGKPVGDGTVGPISRRLYQDLRKRIGA